MSASYVVVFTRRHGFQPYLKATAQARGLQIVAPAVSWRDAVRAAQVRRTSARVARRARAAARVLRLKPQSAQMRLAGMGSNG